MPVPKANRVFTQLNPPIHIFSKTSTNCDLVGKKIMTLAEPLSKPADVHFQGLHGNFFIICVALFSKILQSIIIC